MSRTDNSAHNCSMNILILGSGAREHALAKSFGAHHSVIVSPGNAGIAMEYVCVPGNINSGAQIFGLVQTHAIELVVVGPEDPLIHGVTDFLRENNIPVFGPSRAAGALEGSKIFSKEFLTRAHVRTAAYQIVTSVAETLLAAQNYTPPYVLKADGLCAGKGVHIIKTLSELKFSAKQFFEEKIFGEAGTRALLEEFTPGDELSFLILTNGNDFQALPTARDHKRLLDRDEGPNTGGMGAVAPVHISHELREKIELEVVRPVLGQMGKENLFYRGVLYIGLMLTPGGPSVLEFNCRFGDPEAQVLLPLIEDDLGAIFKAIAAGVVPPLQQTNQAACTVVISSPGYPAQPQRGIPIRLNHSGEYPGYFLFAGVSKNENGGLITNGGRVACATAVADDLSAAIKNSYAKIADIEFDQMHFRKDIGHSVTPGAGHSVT